ncbi:hypothetical protein GCM10009779_55020 [Polymorphospora rubra]|uniref:Uncharacterized protein n=1 Tax=Polymorphospora rubra TaxID=338584 RepID=A0A810N411_9ACTN|nr:hypothetical protein Prubr_34790 [Polymorphospora rubra]
MRLGEIDEFAERVGIQGSIVPYPDNSPDHDPMSHILLSEHDRPPPRRDTRLLPPRLIAA